MKVLTTGETFNEVTEFLSLEEPFVFVRFGDGDLLVMNGGQDAYHNHSPILERELVEAFDMYDAGTSLVLKALGAGYTQEEHMRPGLFAPHNNDEHLWELVKKFAHPEDIKWYNAVTFHYYTVFKSREMKWMLNEFIRPKRKMFIGSIPQRDAERLFGVIQDYIQVPKRSAYDTIDEWWPQVEDALIPSCPQLILPAAGLASRVIAKRIWETITYGPTVIDFGSIVDAAAHRPTRTWIKMVDKDIDKVLL